MLTAPYSIYVNKRPLRTAYLVEDNSKSFAIIDKILADNRHRWGGRYNPIILSNGESLDNEWWDLLEAIDPDIIRSFVNLSDSLVSDIDRRVSPYLVQQPDLRDKDNHRILPEDAGLSILPTAPTIRSASWSLGDSALVLFETDDGNTDLLVKQFAEWNFGEYSRPTQAAIRSLEGVKTCSYTLTDPASLVAPLTELICGDAFTYPVQLCAIPKESLPPVSHDPFGEMFTVVIGDTPSDVAYFWNRPASIPQPFRTYLNQIWIPVDLAKNVLIASSLGSWIEQSAVRTGSQNKQVRFVSLGLPQEQLEEIVKPLTKEWHTPFKVAALSKTTPPAFTGFIPFPRNIEAMDLYRANSTTEQLTIREPLLTSGPNLDEYWMADLFIEFRPERYSTIGGRPLWWQLPRPNRVVSHMFNRPSRVLRSRIPSTLMKRGESRLNITLLNDLSVFRFQAAGPNSSCYRIDARYVGDVPNWGPYQQVQRSDKGRYLDGLLDLFGGLHPTTGILKERYWRSIFKQLSGRTDRSDTGRLKDVGNAIRKHIGANRAEFYKSDKALDWLTHLVFKTARRLPAPSRDLDFRYFESHAKQELKDFNASQPDQDPWEFSSKDLTEALSELTERGVLLMGFQPSCPACGFRDWRHVNEAEQVMRCRGCNTAFPLSPEQRWYYRLNRLALAAIAEHGLLPVVLVLGQLLMGARNSFMFAPCLDLFEDGQKGPVGDLDISAIVDGKYIIGEVKESRGLFDEAAFRKMEEMARLLLPDVMLFASMDREPTRLIIKEIERLSEALRPLDIAVKWYPLHSHIFSASPVR